MAYNKAPNKVAAKYATKAKQIMRDAAVKAIRAAPGFTPDKKDNAEGYHFDATLTEITFGTYQGQPSVTCKLDGVLANYPQKSLVAGSLTGKATLAGGSTDRDVEDCIKAAVQDTVAKQVIPALKKLSKP
jgi:hypothetical protein